jgi:ATP-dependent protease Clp ATPase subunit
MAAARGSSSGSPDSVSTRNILFIASGAFSGLETIIRHRLEASTDQPMGLSKIAESKDATTGDLIRFGLEPEFVGRLPVRVGCHGLNAGDLFNVLRKSESSLIHQYERSFAAYGIKLRFRDDGLRRLAELAKEEETGARGLMTVLERTFRDLKFRLPSSKVQKVTVTAALVTDPLAALKDLLKR